MPNTTPNNNVIDESLQNIPFFRTLSPETLHAISAKMQFVHLEHGQIFSAEGSLCDAMYLIELGQVQVSIRTGNGRRDVLIKSEVEICLAMDYERADDLKELDRQPGEICRFWKERCMVLMKPKPTQTRSLQIDPITDDAD